MSVLFLPPASAASVPDATELVSGKIRIATSAEATTGTNDLTAMTPLKVKSVVDAAVVGGVTYQGTFDTSSPVDLSNAQKGDLYIISVAGSYQGQTWAVGDHLLVNADMGGTISPSKIDKVDNTDAVTSVAGKTGAVTLVAGDVSGLAAVATSGAYSDLSGTPTLGTAAAEDVGTAASNVVQLDGSARLPAVDGSQLLNLPSASVAALNDIGDVTITSPADNAVLKYDSSSSEWVDAFQVDYVYTSTTQTLAAKDGVNKVMFGSLSQTTSITLTVTISSARTILFVLNQRGATCDLVIGSDTWSLATGEGGLWIATGINQAVRVSDLTPTLATVATSGSYDDLSDKPILRDQTSGTVTISAPSSPAIISHVNLPLAASQSVSLPASSAAIAGTQITIHNASTVYSTDVTAQGGDVIRRGTGAAATTFTLEPRHSVTVSYVASGSAVALFVTGFDTGLDVGTSADNLVQLDGSARLPAVDGSQLTNLPSASVAALDDIGDVSAASPANTNVIKYNSTSGDWEAGAVAASEVSGLATVATTGAYSDLSGLPIKRFLLSGSASIPTPTQPEIVVGRHDPTGGAQDLTLPASSNTFIGTQVSVFNESSTVDSIITAGGSDTIKRGSGSAAATFTLGPRESVTISYVLGGTGVELLVTGFDTGLDVGAAADNLVQLDGSARLPAVDGSQLLNLPSAPVTSVAGKTGAVTLSTDDLTDIDTTTAAPVAEDRFKYDGSNWVPVDPFEVVATVTTTTSLTVPEQEQLVRTSGSGITLNLPNIASNSIPAGVRYQLKVTDSNTITVAPDGAELLEGANSSYTTAGAKESLTVVCDGSGWWFI